MILWQHPWPHLVESFKEAVFVLCAPRLPLPTGPLLVTSLLLLLSRPLAPGSLGHPHCGASHRPWLCRCPLGGRAILCPCVRKKGTHKSISQETVRGKKTTTEISKWKMLRMSQMLWLAILVFCTVWKQKKYNCSCEAFGFGNVKSYAHNTTHSHYTAKPAELPALRLSSGKATGKAIGSYNQVQNKLRRPTLPQYRGKCLEASEKKHSGSGCCSNILSWPCNDRLHGQ